MHCICSGSQQISIHWLCQGQACSRQTTGTEEGYPQPGLCPPGTQGTLACQQDAAVATDLGPPWWQRMVFSSQQSTAFSSQQSTAFSGQHEQPSSPGSLTSCKCFFHHWHQHSSSTCQTWMHVYWQLFRQTACNTTHLVGQPLYIPHGMWRLTPLLSVSMIRQRRQLD